MEIDQSASLFNYSVHSPGLNQDLPSGIDSPYYQAGSAFPELPRISRSAQLSPNAGSLVIIDSAVEDYQALAASLLPGEQIFVLDPSQDGIAQISQLLSGQSQFSSLHIVSHGSVGSVKLGNTWLDFNSLNRYSSALGNWAQALAPGADVLLYGCNIAGDESGTAFLQQLSSLIGADVAASTDLTGSSALGGDWELEFAIGSIESGLAFQPEAMRTYGATLAEVYLSNLNPTSATNGYGPYERDRSNGENGATDGRTLTLNGVTYAKGLGVHSLSDISYALNGQYTTFLADIGVDDEVGSNGSVVFQVYGDSTLLYTSGTMLGSSATQSLNLNVSGRQNLRLVVTNAGDGGGSDHADWANARLVTSGGTSDTTPPTASLTAAPISIGGATTYDFTVTYSDNTALNVASLDNADVRVTGPNSFNQLATFVSVNTNTNGTPRTATYRIAAPGGTWDSADNGTYSFALQASQVSDTTGNAAAAATLGTVAVNIPTTPPPTDTTLPTATLSAANVTTAGGTTYTFTVTYADNVGVNVASIGSADVQVTAPGGAILPATLVSVNNSANGTPRTATYSIPIPGGSWDTTDNGTYTVALLSNQVSDTSNNFAAPISSTFQVNIPTTPPPSSTVYLSNLNPTSATNGYGPYERDRSNGENGATDGRTLTLNGVTYAKGLGVHSLSDISYALNGQYTTFLADIGVDDEVGSNGSVVFQVYGDSTLLYTSGTMLGSSATQSLNLNVSGRQTLRLVVTNAGDGGGSDHADWANARLVTSGGTSDTTPPTASLTAAPISIGGATTYDFTVTYSDNTALNVASLDNADIRVTGPNSFNQLATFVSVNTNTNGTPRTATYRIAAPGGTWDSADNGTYSFALQGSQVSDTTGNAAAAATLGTVAVNIPTTPPPTDTTLPTATLSAANVTTAGGTTYTFTVTYADNVGVNVASIGSADVQVTAPGGTILPVTLVSVNNSANGTPRTATYSIPVPGGTWDSADNGTYTVALLSNQVSDTSNNFAAPISSTFQVNIPTTPPPTDTTLPTATLSAANVTTAGGTTYTFTVAYADNVGVNVASIGSTDIQVTAPGGATLPVTLVSVDNSANGTPRTATYSIPVPGGSWDTADNGIYTIALLSNQVSDTSNNFAASISSTFQVNIPTTPPADTTLPTATLSAANVTTAGGTTYTFTVTYADNVGVNVASIGSTDIQVTAPGGATLPVTLVSVDNSANGTPRTATYSIPVPGGSWDTADNGTYTVALLSNQVSDTSNNFVTPISSSFQVNIPTTPPPTGLGNNLVVNGSFEEPAFDPATVWLFFDSVPGWQVSTGRYTELQHGHHELGAEAADDGITWAELDTDRNSGLLQQINTTAGKTYQLSFAYSPEPGSPASTTGIDAYWNGQRLEAIALDGTSNATNVWRTYTYQVQGTGGLTNLEFRAAGISDATGGYIDNVQLREVLGGTTPSPGSIGLGQTSATVSEGAGKVSITLVRTGGSDGVATAGYEATNGSPPNGAIEGSDFTAARGTVTFQSGETSKVIEIPIINDTVAEGNEIFNLALGVVTGATAGTPRTAQITIIDDDGTSSFSFAQTNQSVDENVGTATITVQRNGNTATAASVNYAARSGSATAGSDFTEVTGTLNFAVGQTTQTFAVPITNDTLTEGNETITLTLSSPSSGGLGGQSTSTLTILDNDSAIGSLTRQTVVSGLTQPTAIDWSPDGRLMFIAQKNGVVRVVRDGQLQAQPFIDISSKVNTYNDRGLLGIAVHPDFYNGKPYVYLLYTYDPPEVYTSGGGVNGPDANGNRPARLEIITADVNSNYTKALAGPEQIILGKNSLWQYTSKGDSTDNTSIPVSGVHNGSTITAPASLIEDPDNSNLGRDYMPTDTNFTNNNNIRDYIATDSITHTIGSVLFGPDGALYVSVGDGSSYNFDPRTIKVQDIDNLSGKLLRIDPLTGEGLSSNPFWNGDANSNRSKVYNYGIRNSFRFTIAPNGVPLMGEVGWNDWEEVNMGAGKNFGWPYYEGGSSGNLQQGQYSTLPQAQAFYTSGTPVTAPIYARSHSNGGRSIMVSDFYNDSTAFIIDTVEGSIRVANFDANYNLTSTQLLASNVTYIVQATKGPDGNMYDVRLSDGTVSRWTLS